MIRIRQTFGYLFRFFIVFFSYLFSGYIALQLAPVGGFASLLWPPSGIALAALLLWDIEISPAILIGAYGVNYLHGASVGTAALIASGNTLSGLTAYLLLHRFGFRNDFSRLRDAFSFLLCGPVLGTVVSATIGVGALWISGTIESHIMGLAWSTWWLGDAIGMLLITPAVLAWSIRPSLYTFRRSHGLGLILLVFISALLSYWMFGTSRTASEIWTPRLYLAFLPLIWGSARYGSRGTVTVLMSTAAVAIPIVLSTGNMEVASTFFDRLIRLQGFMGFFSTTGILLMSAISERDSAILAMRNTMDELENRVVQRTKELAQANDELRVLETIASARKAELSSYIDHMSTFNAKISVDGRVMLANQAAIAASGFDWEHLYKTHFIEGPWFTFDRNVHDRVQRAFNRALQGENISYHEKIMLPGNRLIWIDLSFSPVMAGGTKVDHVVAEGRDVTAQKQAEEKFRRLLDAAPDAMVIANRDGEIVLVNDQVRSLFGYIREELLGENVEILMPERLRQRHEMHRQHYTESPNIRPMGMGQTSLWGLRKDGTEFPAEISLSPLYTEEGLLIITAIRDVSEKVKAEESRIKLAQAQEAVRLRDEFISIASHELRTPLTALQLQIQTADRILRKSGFNIDFLSNSLDLSISQVKRMTQLIGTLLDVSRIASGKLELSVEEFDLYKLMEEVVARFSNEAHSKKITISLIGMGDFRGAWDRLRIDQVVTNLLSNAMKYGNGRPIELRLASQDSQVSISVHDQGIGINDENKERIFNRFERAVSSKSYGGLGLGLYISKEITAAHGGNISVESQPGKYTTFTVTLPRQTRTTAVTRDPSQKRQELPTFTTH